MSASAIAMPPAMARGNDRMPAITAAASAFVRVNGPRFSIPVAALPLLSRIIDRVAMKPPSVHTTVDTTWGLMPESRRHCVAMAES